jgi:hypothetical protein
MTEASATLTHPALKKFPGPRETNPMGGKEDRVTLPSRCPVLRRTVNPLVAGMVSPFHICKSGYHRQ